MGQPRYACRKCGTWKCAACTWQRPGASATYPNQYCGACGGTVGTIVPTMHTARMWYGCNGAEPDPATAGLRRPTEPRRAQDAPQMYRGVLVPKQGPYQRLDLESWRRGVDAVLDREGEK